MPIETEARPAEPLAPMPWNALMTPTTVPSSPTKGAVEPMVASAETPFEVGGRQGGGALNRAAHGVHEVLAGQTAAALLLKLIFLQAGEHDFGEVRVAVVLGGRERHGVLQVAFLEVLGHLWGVQLGSCAPAGK